MFATQRVQISSLGRSGHHSAATPCSLTNSTSSRSKYFGRLLCSATSRSHYDVLGVSSSATDGEIWTAYKSRVRWLLLRPADTQKEYKNVTDAYQTLKDESLRAAYDSEQEKAIPLPYATRPQQQTPKCNKHPLVAKLEDVVALAVASVCFSAFAAWLTLCGTLSFVQLILSNLFVQRPSASKRTMG